MTWLFPDKSILSRQVGRYYKPRMPLMHSTYRTAQFNSAVHYRVPAAYSPRDYENSNQQTKTKKDLWITYIA